ncbi:MAG TPA: diaminopimelate epimerase [Gemmatimonadetes bacterium]|nr:diaminopimelate epimerase [Gemmatimonadota bacterium]
MAKDYGARPTVGRNWYKAHGLGNDYLVFEEGDGWRAEPEAVARLCHRREGLGGDGLVVVLRGATDPLGIRMFNPDGSEFERSGNGLRVLAAYLHYRGRVREDTFEVECGGDRIRMQVHSRGSNGRYDVEVEMGRARLGPESIALDPAALDEQGRIAHPDLGWVPLVPVSVGNPHVVVFSDTLGGPFDAAALLRLGTGLDTHRAFPHGANVQLVRVTPPSAIDILIWERGVGPTSASGTSACATAVAAVTSGRLDPGDVEVHMEGGSLHVRVSQGLDVVLRGPVEEVAWGELADGFVHALASARAGDL